MTRAGKITIQVPDKMMAAIRELADDSALPVAVWVRMVVANHLRELAKKRNSLKL